MKKMIFLISIINITAAAQQTIFNVPSADVMEVQKTYFELDWLYFPEKGGPGFKDHFFTLRTVHGVAKNVEAGTNVGTVHEGGPAPSLLIPIKWKAFATEEFGLVAGGEAGTTFDPEHLIARGYLKLDWLDGRILRAGIGPYWASTNYYQETSSAGLLMTIEGKLNSIATIAADWTSGNHFSGQLAAGLILSFSEREAIYLAAVRGNEDGEFGAIFEYGHYW